MKLSEDIKPISFLKSHTSELIEALTEHRRPLVITQHGKAKAVLMDVESYDQIKESMAMLMLMVQSEQDIREGDLIEQEDVFKQLEKKFFS